MAKTEFNLGLYHEMMQLYHVSHKQGVKLHAEKLRDHFEIPDRVARYYWFMVENNYKLKYHGTKHKGENRLVVPDLHAPFVRGGFLEHCVKAYYQYDCTKVTFLGDVLDNHFTSFWKTDPDGMSALDETEKAIDILQPWYNAFPEAEICEGNHDARIFRQAFDAGISKAWIKDYSEVLSTPDWVWGDQFDHFDVRYVHGDGPGGAINGAFQRMLYWDISVIQGHWHTSTYVRWKVSETSRRFAFQLGSGMDYKSYTAAYSKKAQKKPIVGCGVVLDNGRIPIHLPMYL